jgi:hypothetical protein
VFIFHSVAMLPQHQHPVNSGFSSYQRIYTNYFAKGYCVVVLGGCMITHRTEKRYRIQHQATAPGPDRVS